MDSGIRENIEKLDGRIIYADGSSGEKDSWVLKEHELLVIINEKPVMKLICTKDHLRELVAGRLFTDGYIDDAGDISSLYFCRYEKEASVFLRRGIRSEEAIREDKSCCTGNRVFLTVSDGRELKNLKEPDWKSEWIFAMARRLKKEAGLHALTQGTHSCMLARGGDILFECEDIGRHNAIDKAVGYGLINGIPLSECIIYTTGRVPVDMAQKVIAAGIPVLASKSVPTAEAISLAGEYGLTIICRAHTDSIMVCT